MFDPKTVFWIGAFCIDFFWGVSSRSRKICPISWCIVSHTQRIVGRFVFELVQATRLAKMYFTWKKNNNIFNCLPHSFQEQELKISWAQEFWLKGCKREHFWLLQYCRHWELKKILLKSVDYRVLIRYVHKKLYIVCNHHISSSIHVNSQFSHTTFWLCSFG